MIPSFVARVERPDRGGEWVAYLERAPRGDRALGRAAGARPPRRRATRPRSSWSTSRAARRTCSPPRCSSRRAPPRPRSATGSTPLDPIERAELIAELAGERRNRRHRPGRGWEAVRYRFEIVSDYGGFRDLQRHRMLTCQWQRLGPRPRRRRPGGGPRGRRRRRVRARARDLAARVRAARGRRARRRRPLRALPRLPDPLRARPERARGDAPDRAALRPRGPPDLPRRRPGDARADRRRPPGDRRGDDATSTPPASRAWSGS